MFAALRSKSKDNHELPNTPREDGAPVTRSSSKGRRGSKGQPHTVEQLHRKIANAEDEIKHHLKCRCKHSAVHAIKKKQMYEKELAQLLKEQGLADAKAEESKALDHENEQALEAEYVRRLSIE
eukprot:CAMPEP_0178442268 /NCGR_PEP_ID=MMETSP0689_2-20121128/38050_1 /TAXON_ID=160604 /ORGANISM="Amphidinium massartii, Strain CS-259" /LENGTH=123 /DNA_ID=CAMNT_0020065755 /DNA_START=101 /DNA_END=469 /DNA_ORIENTATION=+